MKLSISIFILLAVLGFTSSSSASTNVGATLSTDTQWDQGGSPYIIQAHVLVPPGVTLKIEPGVQVVFQGPATLEVGGDLKVEGSAAAPVVFNMTDGGLQSALFIDGGEAFMANTRVVGGVFLVQDATIRLDGADVTKGSGLYLKGTTVAHLKNNKFYGNATGVVLDGPVEADMQFNTIVQNTYGVYVKDFAKIVFVNNSVHDNESEVVNNSSKIKMGGNYWGTLSPTTVKNKIKGSVNISPMKDLKDILRAYLRSELPVITKGMSDQAEAEDRRADEAARAALKAFRAKQSQADVLAMQAKLLTMTPPVTATPVPPVATPTPIAPEPTPTLAMSGELAAPPSMNTPTIVPTATSTALPAAPAPPALPEVSGMPAPPALSSSAPEPPALNQMVAPVETSVVSTPVTLPSSAPAVTSTPTFVLGGGGMTTDDLASIVATAQAASTSTTPASAAPAAVVPPAAPTDSSSSMPSPPAVVIPAPPMSSVSTNPSIPQEVLAAPPMPPDLTNTGSPDTSAQAAAPTSVPTSVPTATFTMVWTDTPIVAATSTDTPVFTATYTPTTVWTSTYTSTPVPAVPTDTPTMVPPAPPMTSAPASAAPAVAAPPIPDMSAPGAPALAGSSASAAAAPASVPAASGMPSAGAPTLAGSAAPAAQSAPAVAPATSSSSAPAAVPPPPDFGDNSMTYGVQAPQVPVNNNPPVAAPGQSSFPSSSTGSKDLDVDGMQAPPMDSGLDFAAPKK